MRCAFFDALFRDEIKGPNAPQLAGIGFRIDGDWLDGSAKLCLVAMRAPPPFFTLRGRPERVATDFDFVFAGLRGTKLIEARLNRFISAADIPDGFFLATGWVLIPNRHRGLALLRCAVGRVSQHRPCGALEGTVKLPDVRWACKRALLAGVILSLQEFWRFGTRDHGFTKRILCRREVA